MKAVTCCVFAVAIGGAMFATVSGSKVADAKHVSSPAAQAADTATARLHISGMTCGTCPATARRALERLAGVHSATVTFSDSLGVVKYDPAKVQPPAIAAHLTRMTGYPAKVLPDSIETPPQGGGA